MRGTPDVTHPDASSSDISHDPGGKRLSNLKRFLIAAAICLLVIGVLAGVKFAQISALIQSGKAAQAAGPPPQAVGTDLATAGVWESTLEAVGSVTAARGVTISNDSPGVVRSIRFVSGTKVNAGQVLVELDSAVERAQLASLKARLGLAATTAGRTRFLSEKGALTKVQLDTDEAQLKTATADVAALEAQIERKIVRAPFAGKLGIRSVNLGQYLNPGTPITVLESTEGVVVDFTIPQQELARVPMGATTRIVVPGAQAAPPLAGKITAVEPNADPATRAVKLRASVDDQKAQLRPGMFVNVSVVLPEQVKVVSIPATAIARAPYGDSVYVVEPRKDQKGNAVTGLDGKPAKMARQQFVRVGQARGDFVAILEGVTAGQEVVSQGGFKLRNGAPLMVNNQVKLSPSQNPRPENH
jgi:membrane fusion protein (multidrug efflux system)